MLTRRLASSQLTGDGIRNSWEDKNKPVYFSANEVPFGAKGSKARKEFMRKEYNKPRTLKSAGAALNNGEDAMYLQREVERVAARGQDEQDPALPLPLPLPLPLTQTLPLPLTLTLTRRRSRWPSAATRW